MAFQVFLQFLNIQDFLGDWYSGFHGCIMSSISQISSSHGFRSYMSASCQVLSSIQGFIGVWRQVFPWFIVPTASQVPLKFRIYLCSVSSVSLVLLISRISEKTGIQGFMGVSCQVFAWFLVPRVSQVSSVLAVVSHVSLVFSELIPMKSGDRVHGYIVSRATLVSCAQGFYCLGFPVPCSSIYLFLLCLVSLVSWVYCVKCFYSFQFSGFLKSLVFRGVHCAKVFRDVLCPVFPWFPCPNFLRFPWFRILGVYQCPGFLGCIMSSVFIDLHFIVATQGTLNSPAFKDAGMSACCTQCPDFSWFLIPSILLYRVLWVFS